MKSDHEQRQEDKRSLAKIQAEFAARKGNSRNHGDEPPPAEGPDDYGLAGDKQSTDIEQAGKKGKHRRRVQELKDFLAEFAPPDYLADGILQRGFCYSLTGKTGSGKSAIGLLLALLVAAIEPSQKFGEHDVEHGRVVYICKENPTDIMMRLKAACFLLGVDVDAISRDFLVIHSIDNIDKDWPHVVAELKAYGDIALIVVDTSIALFTTEDENAPAQMYRHAKKMRALGTQCSGSPTVLVLCHPVKNPNGPEDLVPRGGGSFLNEMDGNLTLWDIGGGVSDLHWCGKFRGPGFEKIPWRMMPIKTTAIMDSKGRIIPTVMAQPVTEDEIAEMQQAGAKQTEALLLCMERQPSGSMMQWATGCGWKQIATRGQEAKPDKSRVQRALKKLVTAKLAEQDISGRYSLTKKGLEQAHKIIARNTPPTNDPEQ
jgi:hypothetical protein